MKRKVMRMGRKITALLLASALAFTSPGSISAEEVIAEQTLPVEYSGAPESAYSDISEQNVDASEEAPAAYVSDATESVADDILEDTENDDVVLTDDLSEDTEEAAAEEISEDTSGKQDIATEDTQTAAAAESAEEGAYDFTDELILSIETVSTDAAEETAEIIETVTGEVSESGLASAGTMPRLRAASMEEYGNSYGEQLEGEAAGLYQAMVGAYVTARSSGNLSYELATALTFAIEATSVTYNDSGRVSSVEWDRTGNAEYQALRMELAYAVQAAYDACVYDYPEVFWMGAATYNFSISISGDEISGFTGKISRFTFIPSEKYEGASEEIGAFDAAVSAACTSLSAALPADASVYDTARAIHDYICNNVYYYESKSAHTAASVFLHRDGAVCEGYAKAFKILCRKFDIESVLIAGQVLNAAGTLEGHMWNYVRMEDNEWYLVDTTWDDRSSGLSYTYFLVGSSTIGYRAVAVQEEREQYRYSRFSNAAYTQDFVLAQLSVCGYKAHVLTHHEAVAATCTGAGNVEYYSCSNCGRNFSDADGTKKLDSTVTAATGHTWISADNAVAATCTEDGKESDTICAVCGEILEVGAVIPATGHSWDSGVVTKAASCTEPGIRTYTCSTCGAVSTEDIPATGHSWGAWKTTAAATVFSAQVQTRACSRCGDVQTQTVGSPLKSVMTLNASSLTMKVKQSTTALQVSGMANGDYVKSVTSGNSSVVRVVKYTKKGKIKLKALKKGTATLTITLAGGTKKTVKVKVQKTTVKTTKISGLSKKMTVKKGTKTTLKPVITPITSQQKITCTSSNKKVAAVTSKGVIKAKKAGKVKITVKSGSKKFCITVTVR